MNIDDLRLFLDRSPSPFHAVATAAARLDEAGWSELRLAEAWTSLPELGYVRRDGALIAWCLNGESPPETSFRLAGAHTDSPCLRVKPSPDSGTSGWKQLGVEVYGGILNNSWLDRDLGVAGRIILADGSEHLVDIGEPIARVPQLAVHLDRGVNSEGVRLDPQQHLRPVWGLGHHSPGEFAAWLAEQADTEPPVSWELNLYDVQPAAVLGADRSLLASGRLDNLLSCWASVGALIESAAGDARPTDSISMVVLNDHEEVGSSSTTGAGGPFLEAVLERHVIARGGGRDQLLRALSGSCCVSADNAHAVHPNYTDRHDLDHGPLVGHGPAIKVNSNQRYATSPATAGAFRAACEAAGVPVQMFVSRNNMPCGSTIGPITATRLGIATVDVGVPQLSMHSARELCGVDDPIFLMRALTAWFDA